jgi:hypothetical protein
MDDLGLMLHVMQDVFTRIKVGSSEEKLICMISKLNLKPEVIFHLHLCFSFWLLTTLLFPYQDGLF